MKKIPSIQTTAKMCLLLSFFILGGCAAMLNPFDKTDFQCPPTSAGKCISVTNSYNEAIGGGYRSPFITEVEPEAPNAGHSAPKAPDTSKVSITSVAAYPPLSAAEKGYQDATYDKLAGLLRKPVSPIVAPPDVIRVLMLPYKGADGDELYMYRYSYFMATPPKFVIGDYLVEEEI